MNASNRCKLAQFEDGSDSVSESEIVEYLSRAESYSERAKSLSIVETHTSRVFLTDRHAYKLKKRVRMPFLDFTTLPAREAACRSELRLNRRFSTGVYLELLPITWEAGGMLRLNGAGRIVDWVVKMRRLPADRTLQCLCRDGGLGEGDRRRLSQFLAEHYRSQPPLSISVDDYRRELLENVRGNLQELSCPGHGLPREIVRRIHAAQLRMLCLDAQLFDLRVLDGRVIDGHGDLRPDHVYLLDPIQIIDCVEFSSSFRRLDVADELGFLAMECEFLRAPEVGAEVFHAYRAATGDDPPERLIAFYKSYRASVRAKVLAIRESQLEDSASWPNARESCVAHRDAEFYLDLADRYATQLGPPLLLVVCGLSGTGKTSLAKQLADWLVLTHLQTDMIRSEVFCNPGEPAMFNSGIYSQDCRELVYKEMFRRADELLHDGLSVVLDGTFLTANQRQRAATLAAHHGAQFFVVRCETSPELARRRIQDRADKGHSLSAIRPEFLDSQQTLLEPDLVPFPRFKLDTTVAPDSQLCEILDRLRSTRCASSLPEPAVSHSPS